MIRTLLIVLLAIFGLNSLKAQHLEGVLNYHGFADNREYVKSGRNSQTIFGSRIAPEIGLFIDSVHRIRAGVNVMQEYGDKMFFKNAVPILYYQYNYKQWDLYVGSFPRHNLLKNYPRFLLNDTLQYYKPNIEGIFVNYKIKKYTHQLWIDWTGKQTDYDRETFMVGMSGKLSLGKFFIDHQGYLFHNAFSSIKDSSQYLQDNGGVKIRAGLALNKFSFLDSLTIAVGNVTTFERTRKLTDFHNPSGITVDFFAKYRRFELENTYYRGEGHHLIYGDSFYTSKEYNRTDISWRPIMYKNLEGGFKLSFHFVDNVVDNQQSFSLRYRIQGSKKIGKGK